MISLRELGILLLAAPVAIAAPRLPADASTLTVPFSKPEDTSNASAASAVATTSSIPIGNALAKCEKPLRFTTFKLYSDAGCQNAIFDPFTVTWDPCKSFPQTPPLSNGVIFQSMVWTGGSNAIAFYACQQGFSCNQDVYTIVQNPGVCSSGGGKHFDKIVIQP